jgi:hypothetical protein
MDGRRISKVRVEPLEQEAAVKSES